MICQVTKVRTSKMAHLKLATKRKKHTIELSCRHRKRSFALQSSSRICICYELSQKQLWSAVTVLLPFHLLHMYEWDTRAHLSEGVFEAHREQKTVIGFSCRQRNRNTALRSSFRCVWIRHVASLSFVYCRSTLWLEFEVLRVLCWPPILCLTHKTHVDVSISVESTNTSLRREKYRKVAIMLFKVRLLSPDYRVATRAASHRGSGERNPKTLSHVPPEYIFWSLCPRVILWYLLQKNSCDSLKISPLSLLACVLGIRFEAAYMKSFCDAANLNGPCGHGCTVFIAAESYLSSVELWRQLLSCALYSPPPLPPPPWREALVGGRNLGFC